MTDNGTLFDYVNDGLCGDCGRTLIESRCLWCDPPEVRDTPPKRLSRSTDPATSKAAAARLRTGSQKARLLAEYEAAYPGGLIDEEACTRAGLPQGWKRCSDLRNEGRIVDTGQTKVASTGQRQMVCRWEGSS